VIDPGPDMESHVRALSVALESAEEARILLTHWHRDHAGAAIRLAERTGAVLMAPPSFAVPERAVQGMREGERVPTDDGDLVVLEVPGHSRDHLAFHWVEEDAVFVGDLLLGRGSTTWIGEYPGCVRDYLDSLEKVEALGARTVYPAHGPVIIEPSVVIERFRAHRLARVEEVRAARAQHPAARPEELAAIIYGGEIPERLAKAAVASVEATLFHLEKSETGR
jgi:glyoxylase-like metal-dependent hydrolase (beta-lactamase superfamily II)